MPAPSVTAFSESEACAAWSVADELLLHLEASRVMSEPLILGDLIGTAVKIAGERGDGAPNPDDVRRHAIRLGVIAMRIAMGERLIVDIEAKGTC
jgi:hypothetical protein